MSAHEQYERALAVHRQWLATARHTNNQRHYDLAATTQQIAEEWRLRAEADQSFSQMLSRRKRVRVKEEVYA